MEEQDFLHQLSVKSDVNIELLKDLIHDDAFINLCKKGKTMDAIVKIRSIQPKVGLREAKMVADAFTEKFK